MDINFANVPWGSSKNEVVELLKGKNFKCDFHEDLLITTGTLLSKSFTGFLKFDKSGLSEVSVHLSADNDYWGSFERIKNILLKKYNAPDTENGSFHCWSDIEGNRVLLTDDDDFENYFLIYYSAQRASEIDKQIRQKQLEEEAQAEDLL